MSESSIDHEFSTKVMHECFLIGTANKGVSHTYLGIYVWPLCMAALLKGPVELTVCVLSFCELLYEEFSTSKVLVFSFALTLQAVN